MDYEKKYKDALDAMRMFVYPKLFGDTKLAAENVFPELRESEDERIRKGIIKFFSENEVTPIISYEAKQAWLDWLERQTPFVSMNVAPGFDSGSVSVYHESEKQKEQKPEEKSEIPTNPEWSEEDADILNCCISSIEEAKENRYAYKETDGDTSYDREIDWLKSLRPSWKPSEEQMTKLHAVAYGCPDKYDEKILFSLYNDLKKLKGDEK